MGCFYVESPAMRMLLKKLQVDNYLGLVAASSIIRPGVAKSGMIREYILRHRNKGRTEETKSLVSHLSEHGGEGATESPARLPNSSTAPVGGSSRATLQYEAG